MAERSYPPPDPREVDPAVVKRHFARAAAGYDASAVLQREVASRLLARLDVVRLEPSLILDAGCGTGAASMELAARYPHAAVIGFDIAPPMVATAQQRVRGGRSLYRRLLAPLAGAGGNEPRFVCADLNALPFRGVCADLAFCNLALQWVNDLPRAFSEFRRCLKVGALLSFSTFGPDTLKELRAAFARADGHTHVNRFADMHDVGDMLVEAGYADPVMDMEAITLTYGSPEALMHELKAIGATNATRGRPRGLTGRARLARVVRELEAFSREGRFPLTFEVVYGHAWKGEPRRTAEGLPIVQVKGKRG